MSIGLGLNIGVALGAIGGAGDIPAPDFFLPLTSSLTPLIGVGSPTFTRNTTATVWGYDNSGNWTLLTIPSGTPRFEGARWTGSTWTDTFPDGSAIPNATLKGYLAEGQRTNLLLNSASLSTQSISVTAQDYTLSFYGTGSVTLSGAYSGSLSGTGANTRVQLSFMPSAGTLTLTVSGTVSNAQLEAGAFASSYIPTTSATVTRDGDVLTYPGGNTGEGSLSVMFEMLRKYDPNDSEARTIPFQLGSYALHSSISFGGYGNTAIYLLVNFGSTWSALGGFGYFVYGVPIKVALRMGDDLKTFSGYASGTKQSPDIVSPVAKSSSWSGGGLIKIGSNGGSGKNQNLNIRNVKIWKRALTDTQLTSLTSPSA